MKKILALILTLTMLLTLTAVMTASAESTFTVGLAMHNQTADFTVQLYNTFKEQIEEMGGTVVMTDANGDASMQVNQINDLIIQQVDYIVVCPQDASALGAALDEAKDAGIPVINLDSKVDDADLEKVACIISSDNYGGGYTLGEWIAEHLEDGDELAYLDYPQIEAIAIRYEAMCDAVKDSGKDITLYQQIVTDLSKTVNYCEDLLMAHPKLSGIIGLNDALAMTAYSVCKEFGVENPLTAGFDGSPAGKQSIAAGELTGTVVNSPVSLATEAANAVKTLHEGGTVDFEIPVKMWIIDATNVEEYGLEGWN